MITTFEQRFMDALTIKEKIQIVEEIRESNIPEFKPLIEDFSSVINELLEEETIEEDAKISSDIDNGKYQLYQCTEYIYPFIKGEYYFVRIDDMSSELREQWKDNMTEVLENYISNIKPVIWIVRDSGMGTRKSKVVFEQKFEDFFKLS